MKLLLVGFILTSIAGGFINHLFQSGAREREFEMRKLEYRIKRADQYRDNISHALTSRDYAMQILKDALTIANKDQIIHRYEKYKKLSIYGTSILIST